MTDTKQVAQEIIRQLGGRQFAILTGAKTFMSLSEGGVAFQFGRGAKNKANRVRIMLDYGKDLYNVEFGKIYRSEWKTVSKHEGIYADMLQELFTDETGFYITFR